MATQTPLKKLKFWVDITYRMLRLKTVMVMVTFEAIGYEAVKPTSHISLDFVLAAVMLAALYTSATSFNDVVDEEVDKINLANDVSRPLMTTKTTTKQLKKLGVIAMVVSLTSAALISPIYLVVVVAGIILSLFYSVPPFKISHRGIFASLWLTISYVILPFLAGSLAHAPLHPFSVAILISMYLCFLGRILLKDFRDYEGDKKFGKLNFLVRHGPVETCIASAMAWVLGDAVFLARAAQTLPLVAILLQPIIAAILYALYRLSKEKTYIRKLVEVSFIGRLGNAVAVALLASLTLRDLDYAMMQKNAIVLIVAVFMVVTATSLWRGDDTPEEVRSKQRAH